MQMDIRTLAKHYNDQVTLGWTDYVAKSVAAAVERKALRRRRRRRSEVITPDAGIPDIPD
jgi:hypothetical protein